ncbi:MAG: hypothetical protein LC125_06770 [Burkholderiales bacterium]|nr:hypothetical protein [Burkholderiales bacterium]
MTAWDNMLAAFGATPAESIATDARLRAELQRLVRAVVEDHTFSRAELLDLLGRAHLAPLSDADLEVAPALLNWLHRTRPGEWMTAAGIATMLLADADAEHLRHALAPELRAQHPARELGRLLRRLAWRDVGGLLLRHRPPAHRRDSSQYRVEEVRDGTIPG